ncbi:MAG: LytTR family DNA-binding domain-containing protein [Rhodospirillaceae bacterium]|nr:LytTR family DNA-binding domain-containing protein [Rhodospirillaceae bacterium]
MSGKRLLVLYMAVPLALALFNGLRGSIWAPDIGTAKTFLMFAACSLPLWLFSAGLAHGLLPVVQKVGGHPIIALMVTSIVAVPLSYAIVLVFITMFGHSFPGLENALESDGRAMVGGFWGYVSSPRGLMVVPLLIVAHWVYEVATGEVVFYPGFIKNAGAPSATAANSHVASPQSEPGFFKKLRPDLGRNILALEAHEHYIKIHTDRGHELIHYRFGDAVRELGGTPGLQVHRSYWVAQDAVVAVSPAGKSFRLTLCNGLTVPVSLSFRGALQQHRLLTSTHQEFMAASAQNPSA